MPYLLFMIIVTGAAGFIGSQIAVHLASRLKSPLCLVDKIALFNERGHTKHLDKSCQLIDASEVFMSQLPSFKDVECIIHMGAITNTAERDLKALQHWNVGYTKALWEHCSRNKIPLIYASSAATYGDGTQGFSDDHSRLPSLRPLNPYGQSKQEFDLYALKEERTPPHWYGLKFFNVYGPHEDHKGRMASSVWHGFHEISKSGQMTLFRSHNPKFKDGEQARDFIFVKDVLKVLDFLMSKKPASGIYNCGTGRASGFTDLAQSLFTAMGKTPKINWIDTPEEFRAAYQYRTEADMTKLRTAGFKEDFTPLQKGVEDYISYLRR